MGPSGRHLTLLYVGLVGAVGGVPFLAVRLTDAGFSESAASALLAVIPACALLVGPLWARVADRTGRGTALLALALTGAAAAYGALVVLHEPLVLAAAIIAFAIGRSGHAPLADSLTLRLLGDKASRYGTIRSWGSMAFAATTMLGGELRESSGTAPLVLPALMLVLAAFAASRLPQPPPPPEARAARYDIVLRHPVLVPAAACALLNGMTITVYNLLLAVHVEDLGLPARVIGWSYGTAMVTEIMFLRAGSTLLGRASPGAWMILGVASGIPRWALTAWVDTPWILAAVQSLHGLTFGCFWFGAVELFHRHAPPGAATASLAVLTAAMFGAGSLLALGLAALVLQDGTVAHLFAMMSAVSAASTAFAWVARRRAKEAPPLKPSP